MANCLMAARASTASRSIVCDRPNPIGGAAVEGPMLVRGFESFVGLYPIPMRHGMTIGELARLFNDHFGIGADLEVIADGGLAPRDVLRRDRAAVGDCRRRTSRRSTRRSSIRARCCSKARTCRKGAGRPRPFELLGAPWVVAERFADGDEPRSDCRACSSARRVFEPTFHKHARHELRRLPDPRARSRDVPAGRDRRRADRGVPRGRSGSRSAGAIRRTSTSTTSCRSTSWRDRRSCARRLTPAGRRATSRSPGSPRSPRSKILRVRASASFSTEYQG